MNNTAVDFSKIQENSYCPYAHNAKIVYGKEFSLGQKQTMEDTFEEFKRFNSGVDQNKLDAFVCMTTVTGTVTDIDELAKLTCDFLFHLSQMDKGLDKTSELIKNADKSDWWYEMFGNRYLPSVFSFLHPPSSPRNTCGAQAIFFMFQPVQSFDRASIPVGTEIPDKIRKMIRRSYSNNGQPYNERLISSFFEGLKVIEGIPNSKVIKWWEYAGSKR